MTIELIAVGKPRSGGCITLADDYLKRLHSFGINVRERFVAEVRAGGRYSAGHAREREGRTLLDAVGNTSANVIALDPLGRLMDSPSLSERLTEWGRPRAVFLIGGPSGHSDEVRQRADVLWSLSPLTFPHELARVLLWEQIYRGITMQRGIPYHK
jgi:23S rRNA (pseudouridine1915-N3)-methyltransferase